MTSSSFHMKCQSELLLNFEIFEFCLFLLIVLPTPVGGGAMERPRGPLLPAAAKP